MNKRLALAVGSLAALLVALPVAAQTPISRPERHSPQVFEVQGWMGKHVSDRGRSCFELHVTQETDALTLGPHRTLLVCARHRARVELGRLFTGHLVRTGTQHWRMRPSSPSVEDWEIPIYAVVPGPVSADTGP